MVLQNLLGLSRSLLLLKLTHRKFPDNSVQNFMTLESMMLIVFEHCLTQFHERLITNVKQQANNTIIRLMWNTSIC